MLHHILSSASAASAWREKSGSKDRATYLLLVYLGFVVHGIVAKRNSKNVSIIYYATSN